MRITPNQPRLRAIALACWTFGAWCVIYGARLTVSPIPATPLMIPVLLLALVTLATGVAFWLLAGDRGAGIVFDAKGLLLNLGHSSAFVSWENIEAVGVTTHRASLFDLGSRRQIGLALRDGRAYVQSYERRLPATQGVLSGSLGLIARSLRPLRRHSDRPLLAQMALFRAKTGYDILIPEALLGGKAEAFARLVEGYRLDPEERIGLDGMSWAR